MSQEESDSAEPIFNLEQYTQEYARKIELVPELATYLAQTLGKLQAILNFSVNQQMSLVDGHAHRIYRDGGAIGEVEGDDEIQRIKDRYLAFAREFFMESVEVHHADIDTPEPGLLRSLCWSEHQGSGSIT